jgi:DNA processing protein
VEPASRAREDVLHWLRLVLVPGVPGEAQRSLLKAFGSAREVVSAPQEAIAAIVGAAAADLLARGPGTDDVERTLAWLEEPGNRLITLGDEDFPRALLEIHDPPTALFAMGRVELLNTPAIAVVGSRSATAQGKLDAQALARALGDAGFCIVSGLAHGIDTAAHRGALESLASSIAVVGTGLDRVYPAGNRALAAQLARDGAIISEFPLGTAPVPPNFPRRNRLISGLARGVLVVEAALGSGSLITARAALEQGRDVFAMPGSIHSPVARGCHQLIREGAKLVETAEDVLVELRAGNRPAAVQPMLPGIADPLLDALGFAPGSLDALVARTHFDAGEIAARLTALEIAGHVARMPGGLFQRVSRNA